MGSGLMCSMRDSLRFRRTPTMDEPVALIGGSISENMGSPAEGP